MYCIVGYTIADRKYTGRGSHRLLYAVSFDETCDESSRAPVEGQNCIRHLFQKRQFNSANRNFFVKLRQE